MTCNRLILRLAGIVPVCILTAVGPALAQGSGQTALGASEWRRERIPVNSAIPEYPQDARRDRLEGEARVCFRVDSQGEVVRPNIRSSTHRIFRKPALKAIRASTFKPLATGELESPRETCRTYRFRLDRLDPLYLSDESTAPQASLPESQASFAAGSPSADPPPQIEQEGLALARADAEPAIEHYTFVTEANPLPPEVPVCKTETRPGTRISYTFCYTPEQEAAIREATDRTYRGLQEERHWSDQTIHQALMKNGYPRGAGLGPR